MKNINIPRSIQILVVIAVLDVFIYLNECRYVNKQKYIAREQGDENADFSYPIKVALLHLLDGLLHAAFYIGLYYGSGVITALSNSNYETISLYILLRFAMIILPVELIKLYYVDTSAGFNKITISFYVYKELVAQFLILMAAYVYIYLFNYISEKFLPSKVELSIIDPQNDLVANNTDENTESTQKLPRKDNKTIENYYPQFLRLLIIYFFIVCAASLGLYTFYKKFWYDKDCIVEPNGKLMGSLHYLYTSQGISLNKPKMKLDSIRTTKLNAYFGGFLKREIVISDNTINHLSNHQLATFLAVCYYRACSQEGILIILTYLLEFVSYLLIINYIIRNELSYSFKSKDFLTIVLPISLVYFYPVLCSFDVLRGLIHKRITYNADEFASDLGFQIADTIVNIYIKNKDAVVHTSMYTLIAMEEPSLQDRLVNIAVAKSKYLIE